MNEHQIDLHLDNVYMLHSSWKPGHLQYFAVMIVKHLLAARSSYTDEVDFGFVSKDDQNVIGSAWRVLGGPRCGILERTSDYRRSRKDSSKGRTVFRYILVNEQKANAFLKANSNL